MADKRMFTKKITESDAFLEMPLSSQCLYFHLNMSADDDGFVNAPRRVMKFIGASDDDLKLLITKRFVLVFESGVIVIKHWRMHNTIRADRYHPTDYEDEFKQLRLKDNNSYQFISAKNDDDDKLATKWQPNGNQTETEIRLDKNRLDKNSILCASHTKFTKPTLEEVEAYCRERNNNVDAQRFIDYYTANGWKVGRNPMKDWKATVRTWERKDKPSELPTYTTTNNIKISNEEQDEILRLMKG